MEQLRGPINDPLLMREVLGSECLEPGVFEMRYGSLFSHQTPFLQLLMHAGGEETTGAAHASYFPQESNFQNLRRLQGQTYVRAGEVESSRAAEQLESCITHASESDARPGGGGGGNGIIHHKAAAEAAALAVGSSERRKRKRPRPAPASKSAEEAESQRMTHIAVERNRRRLMNDYLATLRSLMPPSYVQRGDQASIISGAIEFVKELEQHLLCLQAQKRQRAPNDDDVVTFTAADSLHDGFFVSPQYRDYSEGDEEGIGVDVEATLVQGHVNLKVAGRRRQGQIVSAIAAMEELHLSVLHLNITSLDASSVLYSLNLKMEEACKLGTADEIATAVHRIFSYINAC
ncbi:transcription factor bHLH57-like [Zingiber officinale]|uniref:transcription factor bHLH57-like n=1 Tax=Zingiber officinale TaxID=94328 RepID=UPI001C4C4AF0|nr:transcription factor bHLH57-like [Zingiber officinale]